MSMTATPRQQRNRRPVISALPLPMELERLQLSQPLVSLRQPHMNFMDMLCRMLKENLLNTTMAVPSTKVSRRSKTIRNRSTSLHNESHNDQTSRNADVRPVRAVG